MIQMIQLFAFFLFATGPALVRAEVLSWDDCVRESASQNPDIAVAEAAVKNAEALVIGAWSGFAPQLSVNAGYTQNSVNGGAPTANLSSGSLSAPLSSTQTQFNEGLQVNQSLFNGFSDLGKVRQARANVDVAKAALAIVKATVSSNLKTAFAELLFEQKSVDLTQAILSRQQNNLRMVTLRYEGGNENRGNQLYQAASVSQAQYQQNHARRQVRNGTRQLAVLLGRPAYAPLQVSGELSTQAPAQAPDFERLAEINPNHIQAADQKIASQAAVEISNGGWYPNLNLVGSAGKTGTDYPPNSNRWSIGVTMTFPFFPGTSTISAVESAHALDRQADYALRSADLKVISAMEQAYAALLDGIEQVQVAADFAQGAQARSVIADGKYNTGLMNFEDWSVIDADFTTRQQNLLINQRNAMQAEAAWENAQGVGAIK